MRRRSPSLRAILGVVFAAMLLGVYVVAGFAPERLRGEAEAWLRKMTGGPVEFRELRLVVGFPMHLEVGDLVALGGALRVERFSLRFSALSLLRGRPRASRVVLDGAEVRLQAGPEGVLPASGLVDGWLLPEAVVAEALIASLETTVQDLLSQPGFADSIELKHSRLSYAHERVGARHPMLSLESLAGRFQRSRLRGTSQLWLSAGLRVGKAPQSRFELAGSRARDGSVRVSLATTGLELGTLVALLGAGAEPSGLGGILQGVVNFSSPSAEAASIAVDLVLTELVLPAGESGVPLESERLALRGRVDVDAEGLRVAFAEVRSETLEVQMEGGAPRPLNGDSPLDLSLKLAGLDLPAIRDLSKRAPEGWGGAVRGLLEAAETGRVRALEARARNSLRQWAQLLADGTWSAPADLWVSAELEELSVTLPDTRRVHDIGGRFEWSDGELRLWVHRGLLDGAPLPEVDLQVAGISHLEGGDFRPGRLRAGAVPIPGTALLWELLGPLGGAGASPRLALELDFLHHPALLWPLEDVEVLLRSTQDASGFRVLSARWGGVPLRGSATVRHAGPRRVQLSVELGASRNGDAAFAPEIGEGVWARGRFDMGPVDGPGWQQRGARGAFEMLEGELQLEGVEIGLEPRGELVGSASVDLRSVDELPCEVELGVTAGETESLLWLMGLDSRSASGSLDVTGSLHGKVTRALPLFAGLDGELMLRARKGAIDQSLPPLVALALASQTFDAFRSPGSLRYDHWETRLRFQEGWVSAEAFELDGPDLRLFAAGRVDLLREPHLVEAEIAVFLFRQLDRALGEIPILNWVLMGRNENLLAAFFELEGPWDEPDARALPLRTLSEGPPGDMILAIPDVMQRGLRALGALLGGDSDPQAEPLASSSAGGES